MKKRSVLAFTIVLSLFLSACGSSAQTSKPAKTVADEVFYGNIYTSDDSNPRAEAMAIKDGTILYVGDKEGADNFIDDTTTITDYEDQFLMPGFIDGHVHIYIDAENSAGIHIGFGIAQSKDDYLKIIKDYIDAHPNDEYYRGFGWMDNCFIGSTPTAEMLDEICPDKPIFLQSEDCHSCWVNTKLLEMTGVDANTPNPIGGVIEHDAEGNPNGCFRDTAMDLLVKPFVPVYSVDEYKELLLNAQHKMLSYGYTAYNDVIIDPQCADNICQAYAELDREGKLVAKVNSAIVVNNTENYITDLEHAKKLADTYSSDNFRVTDIKIFMDGIVESETAFVSEPYVDSHQCGADRWPTEEDTNRLYDLTKRINDLGFVAHFHAIGDAAISKALDALAYARENSSNKDIRNVITHLQMCSAADIQRLADLNIIASADFAWAPSLSEELGTNIEKLNVGEERNNEMYPFHSMLEAGVTMAYATDYPAGPILYPFVSIPTSVTRQYLALESTTRKASEALTMDDTLHAMTITSAYQLGRENETGSLEVGKSADFIVLSNDLTAIDPQDTYHIRYIAVYTEGQNVYTQEDAEAYEALLEASGL